MLKRRYRIAVACAVLFTGAFLLFACAGQESERSPGTTPTVVPGEAPIPAAVSAPAQPAASSLNETPPPEITRATQAQPIAVGPPDTVESRPATLEELEQEVDDLILGGVRDFPGQYTGPWDIPFSGSVLIARGGDVLLTKSYGMADFANEVPNTPRTRFPIGQMTRAFTATAIMQLHEKGLLSVDDPISKHMPDYPRGDEITIHHLLSDTSGIRSMGLVAIVESSGPGATPEEVVVGFRDKPLRSPPGEKHHRTNLGFVLLSYLIERVSGQPYEEYIEESIFGPLGMANTGYKGAPGASEVVALGYESTRLDKASDHDWSPAHGAGALYSTVEDLFLWDQGLYGGEVLSNESLELMFSPHAEWYDSNYDVGYGWEIPRLAMRKLVRSFFFHEGFQMDLRRYYENNVVVIVLSNFEDSSAAWYISPRLALIVFSSFPSE